MPPEIESVHPASSPTPDLPGHTDSDLQAGADHKPGRNWFGPLLLLSVIVVALDRWTKHLVAAHIQVGDAITVIPRVFRITHVLNNGAAFSLFAESASPERVRLFLMAFSVLAVGVVLAFFLKTGRHLTMTSLALALILGGAIGNLYDRIRYSYVIDFLEVHIVHYHWPDFNVADSAIVVGACLLFLEMLLTPDPNAAHKPNRLNDSEDFPQ